MDKLFSLKIITPENVYIDSKITSLIVPSKEGCLGIQKKHVELIAILKFGLVSFKKEDKKWQHIFIDTGCLSISMEQCLLFIENIYILETLNEKHLLEEIKQLQCSIKDNSNFSLNKENFKKIKFLKRILESLKVLEIRKKTLDN